MAQQLLNTDIIFQTALCPSTNCPLSEYKSAFKRDNSVARFSGHGFGRVHYFVKLNTLRSCGPSFYALVKVMERSSERSDDIPRSSSERHMVALRPSCGQLIAVNVKDITDVCVCVAASDKLCSVSVIPNKVEKEMYIKSVGLVVFRQSQSVLLKH